MIVQCCPARVFRTCATACAVFTHHMYLQLFKLKSKTTIKLIHQLFEKVEEIESTPDITSSPQINLEREKSLGCLSCGLMVGL